MTFLKPAALLSASLFSAASLPGRDLSHELNERYAPHPEWERYLEPESLVGPSNVDTWWRTPAEVRANLAFASAPLSGLHIALDPGHIGGDWAGVEGREFKIKTEDHLVREGELVLTVAKGVKEQLEELGAEVTLLRNDHRPLNPNPPESYFAAAAERVDMPVNNSWSSFVDYALDIRNAMHRMYAVTGELVERARLVNEVIRPDALISLHINAAPWPRNEGGDTKFELVDSNHTHVLIFGCLSNAELSKPKQRQQLLAKLHNGSGAVERELGQALGQLLGDRTGLPASNYSGNNAVRLKDHSSYLWARNLMLLRYVECPVILLEPYIANSKGAYPRIQQALESRAAGAPPGEDDILIEYADAVVAGLLKVYGPAPGD